MAMAGEHPPVVQTPLKLTLSAVDHAHLTPRIVGGSNTQCMTTLS